MREKEQRDKADALAQAFYRYVDVYYGARLAAEQKAQGPAPAIRLRVREDLVHALRDVGADLPEAPDDTAALKAAVQAVRETLTHHDYVFLPLGMGSESDSVDLGIALARVRTRDAARSLELWGRKVDYRRVIYDPYLLDYYSWRARALHQQGPVYTPGRFSGSTVYIDFEVCARRANEPKPVKLTLDEVIREVELRQVAYLTFMRDVPQAAVANEDERHRALLRIHERVLWTVVRYGDPDVALADVDGLAGGDPSRSPELKEAATRVQTLIPKGTRELSSKTTRGEVLHGLADEVWPRLSLGHE